MPVNRDRLSKLRATVREDVIKDATIHVRLTKAIMRKLLERADQSGVPYGVLVRQWIEGALADKPLDLNKRLDRIERELKQLRKQA